MSVAADLLADLIDGTATPCESCESGETLASVRVVGPSVVCESVAKVANACEARTPGFAEFATFRMASNGAESEQRCGSSQDSQHSQGVKQLPRIATERSYRLTKAEGNAAHAVAWDDAAIERFTLRVGTFVLAGSTVTMPTTLPIGCTYATLKWTSGDFALNAATTSLAAVPTIGALGWAPLNSAATLPYCFDAALGSNHESCAS